jgi:hypothetical protein
MCRRHDRFLVQLVSCGVLFAGIARPAQDPAQDPDLAETRSLERIQPVDPISNDRIMGVIPNFSTVSDPNASLPPLTAKQKINLFVKETVDPFTFVSAMMGAGLSQASNGTPQYGDGMEPYTKRLGAALADMATQNFFSDAVLASVLHEDPRYYRMGPSHSIPRRVVYSLTRLIITRRDSGEETFNFSGVGGMAMGISLSNAYYPPKSVSGSVTESRFVSSVTGAALGNLLPEFWPDVKEKLAKWRHRR